MTRKEQLKAIEESIIRIQKVMPQNVVLTGKGKFRGAVSPTERNHLISNEEILIALDVAGEEIDRIASLLYTGISEEG